LQGQRYRVVCADERSPRQVSAPGSSRVRHVYCDAELVHFQLGKHRYSLVPCAASTTEVAAPLNSNNDPRRVLTNRELQIVQLICMGLLTKQVADRLHLSEFTVRSYLKAIYCKLGVRSRGGMVYAYAQVFGLSSPPAAANGDF
jgi:DNA-binding NarL/FixJ family response regulator